MLHDMLRWDLGSWHPREGYEGEGLRRQKERSLSPLAEWFVAVLQEGVLPGVYLPGGDYAFPHTGLLLEDARQRVPRLRPLHLRAYSEGPA
jgi:hypothetical protein